MLSEIETNSSLFKEGGGIQVTPPRPETSLYFLCHIKKNISEFQKGGSVPPGHPPIPLDPLVIVYTVLFKILQLASGDLVILHAI